MDGLIRLKFQQRVEGALELVIFSPNMRSQSYESNYVLLRKTVLLENVHFEKMDVVLELSERNVPSIAFGQNVKVIFVLLAESNDMSQTSLPHSHVKAYHVH